MMGMDRLFVPVLPYGETAHVVERKNYKGHFFRALKMETPDYNPPTVGLKYIDHMVGNVKLGQMDKWVNFYEKVIGFTNILTFDDKDISTEYRIDE